MQSLFNSGLGTGSAKIMSLLQTQGQKRCDPEVVILQMKKKFLNVLWKFCTFIGKYFWKDVKLIFNFKKLEYELRNKHFNSMSPYGRHFHPSVSVILRNAQRTLKLLVSHCSFPCSLGVSLSIVFMRW